MEDKDRFFTKSNTDSVEGVQGTENRDVFKDRYEVEKARVEKVKYVRTK